MKFLIRIFFLLIISVLFFNNIEKEFVCPVECENDKHEVIFDKQLSDYKDCVLKNVFEKPSLSRTITYSSPTASVRTVNSLKKISNNLSIVNAVKCFCVKKHLQLCKISSEDHSLYDTDIFYLVFRHILI